MANGHIRTYYNGTWHDGDVAVMNAADHGIWQGTSIFDGARRFDGRTPDLLSHCTRANRSARAMMLAPTMTPENMVDLVCEGLKGFDADAAIYIRPMYWAIDGNATLVAPDMDKTGFSLCLEEIAMPPASATATLTRTRFRRPVLEDAVCNTKAGCLYPNNARMMMEARSKGFLNALVADALGNVAETATSNIFMVRDGAVFTPVPNGTFLAGITRSRIMHLLQEDGVEVHEAILSFDDFHAADEVFMTGNFSKVTPVTGFDDTSYQVGPIATRARELYWDWAATT
ncbi:MAG: branched-chain amino acid aminotransferase [Rhodobacteraceae bacterium]|nr:branched-chain amino acid aminotransferase [Paracoccaceae bacterium]